MIPDWWFGALVLVVLSVWLVILWRQAERDSVSQWARAREALRRVIES